MSSSSRLARREEIMHRDTTEAPTLPVLAIRGYLCFRCLEHKEKLMRCVGCQRAYYCSKECQPSDWRIAHRGICKPLKSVNEVEKSEDVENRTWMVYTDAMLQEDIWARDVLAKNLNKTQVNDLTQIIIAQPYCINCHLTGFQLACRSIPLKTCTTCNLVSECSKCPSTHSKAQCAEYKAYSEIEIYRLRRFENLESVSIIEPVAEPLSMNQYTPLSSYGSWTKYFLNTPVRGQRDHDFYDHRIHSKLVTDSSTMSITTLAALEISVPDLAKKESLTIHLVGAAGRETKPLLLWEDLLHLLPILKHLHVVLCGPNVLYPEGKASGDLGQDIDMGCCDQCMAMSRKRSVAFYHGVYHDYTKRPAYKKPDLAVLFHSGRSQEAEESWKPTTRFLVESGTRTVCTTYTMTEAKEEVVELDALGAKLTLRPEENPWRGLGPLPELLENEEHTYYYQNYYWYIFEGKKS